MIKKFLSSLLVLAVLAFSVPLISISVSAGTYGVLTYSNYVSYVTITSCATTASGNLTVPATIEGLPVTIIGDNAFYNCSMLTSVTIPNSVTSMGSGVFYGCSTLASVTIPSGVTSIKNLTFCNCLSLTGITIPNSVTSIGGLAFFGCAKLTSVTIPGNVTSIGDNAFQNCTTLANVTIPNSVLSIGSYAFSSCSALTSVTIPDNVTSIRTFAFNSCTSLTSVTIPDGVTSIEAYAFYGCSSLTSIKIPDSVITIGNVAFSCCTALASVVIPNSVTSIGTQAFFACSGLTSAIIPANTAILGTDVFKGTVLSDITFRNVKLPRGIRIVEDKGSYSAADVIDLSKIETDDAVDVAVYNPYTTIIGAITHLPASSVTLRSYYTNALTYANNNGYTFKAMTYTLTAADLMYTTHNSTVEITGCKNTITVQVAIPSMIGGFPVTSIGCGAFENFTSLIGVTIPDGVAGIAPHAFYRCSSLKSVAIPDSVTNIGFAAFSGCSSLTDMTIPDSVTVIGDGAFWECSALTNVTIPDSVTSIGQYAFYHCAQLQNIFIPDSVISLGIQAFSDAASSFTLYCYDNSAAKTYAVNNGLSYVPVAPFALKAGSPLVMGADMLTFAQGGMTVTALLNEFTNTNFTVHKNNSQITGGAFVGTGCELKLIAGPLTAKVLTAVVMGDLSGDGAVDALDAFLCDKAANSHSTLAGAYYTAANLDTADPDIDIKDVSRLMNRAVGK